MQQITVEKWFEQWLEVYIKPCRKQNTYLCYQNIITMIKRLDSKLCALPLGEVKEYHLQKMLNEATHKYSKSTLKKTKIVFSSSYDKAVHNKLCEDNPAFGLTVPEAAVKKVRALTRQEEALVRAAAQDDPLGFITIFFLDTGIRTCELIDLQWCDYVPDKHEIHIRNSKTKSGVRTVPLIKEAEAIVRNQPHRGLYIFTSTRGTPLTKTVLKRLYERLRKKTGISIITNHVYRHSFATRMIERGADYKALSAILGHASVDFTLDTYADAETDFLHEQISVLEEAPKRRIYKVKSLCLKRNKF